MYTEETKQRFNAKVQKTDTCWLWAAATNSVGYGQLRVEGKALYAHRMSYLMHKGPIPTGQILRHTCDIPHCVNPEHLIVGTHKDNTEDARDRNRFGAQRKAGNSKLTWEAVREIRKLLKAGTHTKAAIGALFGVSAKTVYHIEVGNQWVDGPSRPGFHCPEA